MITDKVAQVSCGIFHTLILTGTRLLHLLVSEFCLIERGKVFATGGNTFGQLGIGNKKSTNVPVRVKDLDPYFITRVSCGHHSGALTDAGEVFLWGTGVFGEFVSPFRASKGGVRFKDIEIGSFFGAAIDDTGLIWTWGSNTSGELGLGDYEPRKTMTPNKALQGRVVSRLSCGGSYVIALGIIIKTHRRRNLAISPSNSLQGSKQAFFSKTPQGMQSMSFERPPDHREGRGEHNPEFAEREQRRTSVDHAPPYRNSRGDTEVLRKSPFRVAESRQSDHEVKTIRVE